jgi:xylulokinase
VAAPIVFVRVLKDPVHFLGLDVGTSGVKAILVSRNGDVVASATVPLQLFTPHPGWAEQDPEAWWQASVGAIRQVLAAQPDGHVAAIGISGQMHSSVFLDRHGAVIRPALLWCDGRTTAECREITERVGGESRLRDLVSNPALEGFTLPKVLWLRSHEPEAFARLATVLLAKDFVRYKLTGTLATEPSDASATLMYDTAHLRWSTEILDAVDLPHSIVPDVGGSSEILGRVTPEAAALTGLPDRAPVVGGGADNACGAAGVGAITPGEAVTSWGTSGTVLAPTSEPRVDPGLRAHTFCHVAPGVWYLMGVVLSAGGAFAWYRDQFARDLVSSGNANERLNAEAAAIPPGAEGVTFLPYLQGERTPHRDASARGAFVGLSLAHSRAHLTRAVLEGVCFALRDSVSILQELGISPHHMLLTGGGAKSAFVRRLQAEVFGIPVCTVNREEGPAYGAALLAAVGAGAFPDLAAAARATLERGPLEQPAAETHRAYAEAYERFKTSYRAAHPGATSVE